jgi:hypothetical protein
LKQINTHYGPPSGTLIATTYLKKCNVFPQLLLEFPLY